LPIKRVTPHVAIDAAETYARKHALHALVVTIGGRVVCERYAEGYDATRAHALYSGTKSFWGVAAIEAVAGGLLTLDDSVAGVIPEFAADERSSITPRMLLQMTAGYGFGGLGSAVPTYARALDMPLKHAPGSAFVYSGIPMQVFGAYFSRVLRAQGITPHEYLDVNVLQPAGVRVAAWRTLGDGTHPLPTGAQLTAADWLAYGDWVTRHRERYRECFIPSAMQPRYGLCWWLGARGMPADLFYASGSGGQALYAVPSLELVAVHFGKSPSYKHEAFLKRLLE
jgi:CubicO group peptidase (beta-lactamase class C family)